MLVVMVISLIDIMVFTLQNYQVVAIKLFFRKSEHFYL